MKENYMKNIDDMLETASKTDFEVPPKVHYRLQYTLKNKRKNKNYIYFIKRLVTTMASLILVFMGTVSVYAVCGGTINGKPVLEWLGIKFSDEYENYRVEADRQELYTSTNSSIKLEATVCDDGFTVLEFNIKLSDKDIKQMKIGETLSPEETFWDIENNKPLDVEPIFLSFNDRIISDETGTYIDSLNNFNIIIDGEEYWLRPRTAQTVTQISESEFKVYQMYFLTDKELNGKEEFTITLENVCVRSGKAITNEGWEFVQAKGQFDIKVSKENAVKNTKVIIPKYEDIREKDMTKNIDKIWVTALQTIVRVRTTYEDVSLNRLENTKNIDYIDTNVYDVYNEKEEKLSSHAYETKRIVTYSDGKTEEWEQGDIGTSNNFTNAKIELTEYIIIEKDETKEINITVKNLKENILGNFKIDLK